MTRVPLIDRPRREPHPARTDGKKYCPECEEILPLSEFRADPRVSAGVVAYCNPCRRKLVNAWRQRKRLLQVPEGYKRCRTCKEVKLAAEFEHPGNVNTACRPCVAARKQRALVAARPRGRARYWANRDSINANARAKRKADPKHQAEMDAKYRQAHPWSCIDRSRLKNIPRQYPDYSGTIVAYSCIDIFCRDNWDCQLCGEPVDPQTPRKTRLGAIVFHPVPFSQNGDDSPENAVLAHQGCGARRGTMVEHQRSGHVI